MLRNLSVKSKARLLKLYNKVWVESSLPDQWKEAVIVPICKQGKDPSVAGGLCAVRKCLVSVK